MYNEQGAEKQKAFGYLARKVIGFKYINRWTIFAVDLFLVTVVSAITFWFIGYIADSFYFVQFGYRVAGITILASVVSFLVNGTHNCILRYTSSKEILKINYAMVLKFFIELILLILLKNNLGFGPNVTAAKLGLAEILNFGLSISALIFLRLSMVLLYNYCVRLLGAGIKRERVLVFGSDENSVSCVHYLEKSNNFICRVIGFIEVGDKINHHRIFDKRVYNIKNRDFLKKIIIRSAVTGIVFSSKKAVLTQKETLLPFIRNLGVKIFVLSDTNEINKSTGSFQMPVNEINIEDLLSRDEIEVDMQTIAEFLSKKVVLVTGAAGSIGSELCRIISTFDVQRLIMLDNAETPVHELKNEIEKKYLDSDKFSFLICDVREKLRLEKIIQEARPDIIYHAAAYKHVPMMENNPTEAIAVNVQGTVNVATLALKYNVDKMIMISTDKAVNPTNIMGASKRIAEIYTQSLSRAILNGEVEGKTKFITTRFGNVLGSNGSVIPMFKKQIAEGGPVTVTHKDIVRYFMSIKEACRLVLEASVFGKGYEIFIFDMGEPIKIADLAKNMITLAGYTPDVDIKIEYSGLRPGEKLYEELLNTEENTIPTKNKKIFIAKVMEFPYQEVKEKVFQLTDLARNSDVLKAVKKMKEIVPEFKSKNSVFEQLDKIIKT